MLCRLSQSSFAVLCYKDLHLDLCPKERKAREVILYTNQTTSLLNRDFSYQYQRGSSGAFCTGLLRMTGADLRPNLLSGHSWNFRRAESPSESSSANYMTKGSFFRVTCKVLDVHLTLISTEHMRPSPCAFNGKFTP